MMTINRGYIDLIFFSFCIGLVGVCVKATENLDALTVVFYRGAIAVLFILMLGKGHTLSLSPKICLLTAHNELLNMLTGQLCLTTPLAIASGYCPDLPPHYPAW